MNKLPTAKRLLSSSEKFWWVLNHHASVNFVMQARVTGNLPAPLLRTALEAVQRRHPLLRVRIVRQGRSHLSFDSPEVGPIPLKVIEAPIDSWTSIAEQELTERFLPEQGPLVRCILVAHTPESSTVLLTFHHSVGDAMSGVYLLKDIFKAAALVHLGQAPTLPALEPPPAMNDLFPPWAKGLEARWRYAKMSLRMIRFMLQWGLPTVPRSSKLGLVRKTGLHLATHELEPGLVNRLHEKARKEQTTLHGALLAAQLLAVARDRHDTRKRAYLVGSPVNLRRKLVPPVGEAMGFFVTMGVSVNRVEPSTDFWSLARAIRQSLWSCVERGEPLVYVVQHQDLALVCHLLGLGRLGRQVYGRLARLANLGGLVFSNIGQVDLAVDYGSFAVDSLGFAACGAGISPFMAFAATTKQRSTWNFVGMSPWLTREHTFHLAHQAWAILRDAMGQTEVTALDPRQPPP